MRNRRGDILYLIAIFIVWSAGSVVIIVQHEHVHKQIYAFYGIDSEIDYFASVGVAITTPESPCPDGYCRLAHHNNEAISYVIQPLWAFGGLLFFLKEVYTIYGR